MQKEKSIGRNILIVVLILVTIASVCAGLFAWAKYQTTINGTATGETAKWSFKVSDGNTSTQEIEFPMTRKDNNTSVATGKIAPGTYGELEIGIDATGTETALTYTIEGELTNLPTNMKFYSDAERTSELTVLNNKFSKGGYMKLNEIGVRTEKIYWEWPFETGTSATVIEKNDEIDTQDSSKTMSMQISVTGKQLNGNPVLADLVQVGDYVNYDASSNGTRTFTSSDCLAGTSILDTISTVDAFDSNEKSQWRVMSVDRDTGLIELIAVESSPYSITLSNIDGYANGETILNNIGAIYGQGKGAEGGRSLNLGDIEKYSNYDKTTHSKYNLSEIFTFRKSGSNLDVSEVAKLIGSSENPVTVTQSYYNYDRSDHIFNKVILDLFFNKSSYVLASHSINIMTSQYADFGLYKRTDTYKLGYASLYNSAGYLGNENVKMVPVVTLNTNIKTIGQNADGVWQLDV